jgi:hypothetical protein
MKPVVNIILKSMYVLTRLIVSETDLADGAAAIVTINVHVMYKIFLLSAHCTLFFHTNT